MLLVQSFFVALLLVCGGTARATGTVNVVDGVVWNDQLKTNSQYMNREVENLNRKIASTNSALQSLSEEEKVACVIPTSSHSGPGYDSFGETWGQAIEEAVLTEFPDDCLDSDQYSNNENLRNVCNQQGSLFCKVNGVNSNISTASAVLLYDKSQYSCKIVIPAHALASAPGNLSPQISDCGYYNGPSTSMDSFARVACNTTTSSSYCIARGNLTNAKASGNLNFDWTGYSPTNNSRPEVMNAKDYAQISIPVAGVKAEGTPCAGRPVVDKANVDKVLAAKNLSEFLEICDQGVAVCAAFTGPASGNQRCVIRNKDDVKAQNLYHFHTDRSLGDGMIVNYLTNFPGASGAVHSCLRSTGRPIPFAMSVGMRRYYREGEKPNDAKVDGKVESAASSISQDVRNSEKTKRNFVLKGDRSRNGNPDYADFEIASPINF